MTQQSRQTTRTLAALKPGYFKIDRRSLVDLYRDTMRWARGLRFSSGNEHDQADWSVFFEGAEDHFAELSSTGSTLYHKEVTAGTCPPQLALFLTFLKLYRYNQDYLNELIPQQLYHFYHNQLSQQRKDLKPDKVYIFFELARDVEHYYLEKGTVLLASSTAGKLEYGTDRDIFLNNTKVVDYKAINNPQVVGKPIYALPVANSLDGLGKPLSEGLGWYPFGKQRVLSTYADIGFGVASSMFLLKGGDRTINLGFSLVGGQEQLSDLKLTADDFKAELTGYEGWLSAKVQSVSYENGSLNFSIILDQAHPEVVNYSKDLHGPAFARDNQPVLKILLKPLAINQYYQCFRKLQFAKISIDLSVEGVKELRLSNDFGDLDASKSYQPFGYSPGVGDNFYITLEEAIYKPINSYHLNIFWKGKPPDFKIHYEGYLGPTNSLVNSEDDFKIHAYVSTSKRWHQLINGKTNEDTYSLFASQLDLQIPKDLQKNKVEINPDSREFAIRLTLAEPSSGFGHNLYPSVYAKAIITQLNDEQPYIPNEPYTPVIEAVEIGYQASASYDLKEDLQDIHLFHVEPFGIDKLYPGERFKKQTLGLPLMASDYQLSGHLYLGLKDLHPPQQLSLFFGIQEELPVNIPDPEFYYLSDNTWSPLTGGNILSDSTQGLKKSGIVVLNMPRDITSESSRMPHGLYWIRVSVPSAADDFYRILTVHTNGVSATLQGPLNFTTEINGLSPGSIKSFKAKVAEIKKIHQPYASFDGRPAETEMEYFTRVSEKLRHKMRGISRWDIERIVLQKFPEIFQVKCIAHRDDKGILSPGSIHVVVIPVIRNYQTRRMLKPTVASADLESIQEYISRHTSGQVKIFVTNPEFQEISLVLKVNFNDNVDTGFYIQQLQNDLQSFFSPWAFSSGIEINMGTTLYRSSIIEFIESNSYVNFILSIKILVNGKETDSNEIVADERSVNVSAKYHRIIAVEADSVSCQTDQGIDQMIVDVNFDVV